MASNPLAVLSAAERDRYRTAMTALACQAFYRSWQRSEPITLERVVDEVRDDHQAEPATHEDIPVADEDAPLSEVHRAVARLERTGLIENIPDTPDLWQLVELWGPGQQAKRGTAAECDARGCMRPLDHPGGHLPDATEGRLSAELVIHDKQVTAAWAPGSPWVRIYANPAALAARTEPLTHLPVPHTLRFTPDALVDLVTSWLNQDDHPPPTNDPTTTVVASASGFVFTPGTETGTLVVQHSEYFAVWHHERGHVEFYDDALGWDDGMAPGDTLSVAPDVPFTGAILDQICEGWLNRALDAEKGKP
jgi:hypothetical protein